MSKENYKYNKIAVVGLSFRLPGDIQDAGALWDALVGHQDLVTQIPEDRWSSEVLAHPKRKEAGRSITFSAGVLSRIDEFDAEFFGISPREACQLDPQQRLLLELAWESMEDAGIPAARLAGTDCAVYVGISSQDYGIRSLDDLASLSAYSMTGNTASIAANRLSYTFDLHGPSLAVDTACSSSLVALHHACRALETGEASTALVGGVNMLLHPYPFIGFTKASMLSASGRCRTFDVAGDGYVRAEGAAVLLLKPLEQAIIDGDRVHAVIRASGVNADGGRKNGLTIPSTEGQIELMRMVLGRSGLSAGDIDYLEAHGTGTAIGDPIETAAISAVYGQARHPDDPLPIGSIKTNVGHLESASGMAGLIKALLVLKNRQVPPSLHLETPDPQIEFANWRLQPVKETFSLEQRAVNRPLRVGVNSFGFGGANAHVLLEEYQAPVAQTEEVSKLPPLILSARSVQALREQAGCYADILKSAKADEAYDIAYAAAYRRDRLNHRLAVQDHDPDELANVLRTYADSGRASGTLVLESAPTSGKLAFVYSGNGSQWVGMGQMLLAENTRFKALIDALEPQFLDQAGFSLNAVLSSNDPAALDDTAIAQPALFAIQYALTVLLAEAGIKPDMAAGHSVGEIAAAWCSGALTLDEALQVISARSAAQARTRGAGRMAAATLSEEVARQLIAEHGLNQLEIAGVNSPKNITLSGPLSQLEAFAEVVRPRGIAYRLLDLDYAFHSQAMDPVHSQLAASLRTLDTGVSRQFVFVSTVTGAVHEEKLDADYWWDNIRQPVRFSQAIEQMAAAGCRIFVEIGPHAILQRYLKECLAEQQDSLVILPSLRKNDDGIDALEKLTLRLLLNLDHRTLAVHFPVSGRFVDVPTYPWQRQRYWHPETNEGYRLITRRRLHPLLGWPLKEADAAWENILDTRTMPWLKDHNVAGAVVLPGAAYVEMALAASRLHFGGSTAEIEELDIIAPLVLDDEHGRQLRFELNLRDGSFQIRSQQRLEEGAWTLHATGRLLGQLACGRPVAVPGIPQESVPLNAVQHYALADRLGLHYGPSFQTLVQVFVGQEALSGEFAHNDADNSELGSSWLLHPAHLDACFQSLIGFFRQEIEAGIALPLLPVKVGKLKFLSCGKPSHFTAQVRRCSLRSVLADFALFAADGTCLVELTGCRFRAASLRKDIHADPACWEILPHLLPGETDAAQARLPNIDSLAGAIDQTFLSESQRAEREHYFHETQPLIEALATAFVAEAVARLFTECPDQVQSWLQAENGTMSANQQAWWQWVRNTLSSHEMMVEVAGRWQLKEGDLPPSAEIWRTVLSEFPQALQELVLLARVGKQLSSLLTGAAGAEDVLNVIQHSHQFETLFDDGLAYRGNRLACEALIKQCLLALPGNCRLRILEVGGGASSIPLHLRTSLDTTRIDYCIAHWRIDLCDRLEHEYQEYAWVSVKHLDLAKDQVVLLAGEDVPQQFDLILLRHAAPGLDDPARLCAQLSDRLAEGGVLIVTERTADIAAQLIFGPARLYSTQAWQEMLSHNGYDKFQLRHEPNGAEFAVGPWLLLARRCVAREQEKLAKAHHWLLGTSTSDMTDSTDEILMQSIGVSLEGSHEVAYANSLAALQSYAQSKNPDQIVWLVPQRAADDTAAMQEILALVQFLAQQKPVPRLHVLTRGGALLDGVNTDCCPDQAALWGFMRVVMNEFPELNARLIDLPAVDQSGTTQEIHITALREELLVGAGGSQESEVILTSEGRFVPRMQRTHLQTQNKHCEHLRFQLDFRTPGQLRNLIWLAQEEKTLRPGEIEVQPQATGLNFRDVMYVMGLLPDEAVENGFAGASLGLEFSGVVSRVGEGVTNFVPGDAVMGFGSACFASHVVTRASAVIRKPENWSFEAAATVPTTFFTVYYALCHLANLQPGERVLIHGAAGGVGIAAIQLARYLGAEIFATAGNEEKRQFVELLGADHVFDSRSLAYADEILAATAGEGVDVVLNSLAGEAIRRNLRVLRPFGRFLELGKRDFFENTPVGLRPFKDNISYFGIDADQLLIARPELADRLFHEVMTLFSEGQLFPLPLRAFPAEQVVDAFRYMQQARQIGKVVVSFADARVNPQQLLPGPSSPRFKAAASYLVTGGLSGFGLATARWLASNGAGRLILLGRRGPATPGANEIRSSFSALGAEVDIVSCDVTDAVALQQLLATIPAEKPLKGIFHAAMVIDDALIPNLNADRMHRVLDPKIKGAWQLHRQTQGMDLDHFLLYSSVTTYIGNPGQANYVAANAWLEGLAILRRAAGLPVTCIGWGPIGDAGYLTRNTAVRDGLSSRLGAEPLSTEAALRMLGKALLLQPTNLSIGDFSWSTLARYLPSAQSGRFARLRQMAADEGMDACSQDDFQALIVGKTPEEIRHIIRQLVSQEVAQVLAISPERIDPTSSLHDLGLDSLMGVELALGLEKRFSIQIPAMLLNEGPSIERVTDRILERLLGEQEESAEPEDVNAVAQNIAVRHGEVLSSATLDQIVADLEQPTP